MAWQMAIGSGLNGSRCFGPQAAEVLESELTVVSGMMKGKEVELASIQEATKAQTEAARQALRVRHSTRASMPYAYQHRVSVCQKV